MTMQRRDFIWKGGALAAGAAALAGCSTESAPRLDLAFAEDDAMEDVGSAAEPTTEVVEIAEGDLPIINWEMATSWPLGLDTIFGSAQRFSERVSALSGGRFTITPRPAGEIVGGLEVLDAVNDGRVQAGHTASYYYLDRSPAMALGTAVPFGMTARQQNAWLYHGGGLDLLNEFYADRFNMIAFPGGNTGVQMGGWFNREINSVADLQGLKMRIPGLGGQVLAQMGVEPIALGGGDIYNALASGEVDAAEFVGPYDDFKLGLHEVASFYYYPGWWEPGTAFDVQVSLDTWNSLPELYQEFIRSAAFESNTNMMAQYDAANTSAIPGILDAGVEFRAFPNDVLNEAQDLAFELYDGFVAEDSDFATIFESWSAFRTSVQEWHGFAEESYLGFVAGR